MSFEQLNITKGINGLSILHTQSVESYLNILVFNFNCNLSQKQKKAYEKLKQGVGSYIKVQYDLDEKMKCVKYNNSPNAALKDYTKQIYFPGSLAIKYNFLLISIQRQ